MKKFREFITEVAAFSSMPAAQIWAGNLVQAGWGQPRVTNGVVSWVKRYIGSVSKQPFYYWISWSKSNPDEIVLTRGSESAPGTDKLRTDKVSLMSGASPRATLQKWALVVNQDLRQADIDAKG